MKERPIITIKEARKLLGKEAQGLEDAQIMDIILLLTTAARSFLKNKGVKRSNTDLG